MITVRERIENIKKRRPKEYYKALISAELEIDNHFFIEELYQFFEKKGLKEFINKELLAYYEERAFIQICIDPFKLAEIKEDLRTKKLCETATMLDFRAIKYVPDSIREESEQLEKAYKDYFNYLKADELTEKDILYVFFDEKEGGNHNRTNGCNMEELKTSKALIEAVKIVIVEDDEEKINQLLQKMNDIVDLNFLKIIYKKKDEKVS